MPQDNGVLGICDPSLFEAADAGTLSAGRLLDVIEMVHAIAAGSAAVAEVLALSHSQRGSDSELSEVTIDQLLGHLRASSLLVVDYIERSLSDLAESVQ